MQITFTVSSLFLLLASINGLQQYVTPTRQRASDRVLPMSSVKEEEMEDTTTSASEESESTQPLSYVLQDIVDERQQFRMNLGRAMDVLKHDYPEILHRSPDFSIYHDQITFLDPSSVEFTGLQSYKTAFSVAQKLGGFMYDPNKSKIQQRMIYDVTLSTIRISWNVELSPKLLGLKPLFIDGISVYTMDSPSGKIIEHKIEYLMINGRAAEPPYSIFSTLMPEQQRYPRGVPVLASNLSKNLISSVRRKIREIEQAGEGLST